MSDLPTNQLPHLEGDQPHAGCCGFTSMLKSGWMLGFLAVATVISSGDNESHAHPRPDALGAFGKHGRGERPLIFSTELARSTREFTPIIKHFDTLRDYLRRIEETDDADERKRLKREMEEKQDRNVAVYGMITLRALDDHVVMAQKLEQPRDSGTKWDIHELSYNSKRGEFERVSH